MSLLYGFPTGSCVGNFATLFLGREVVKNVFPAVLGLGSQHTCFEYSCGVFRGIILNGSNGKAVLSFQVE